jgi:phage tail-like protein
MTTFAGGASVSVAAAAAAGAGAPAGAGGAAAPRSGAYGAGGMATFTSDARPSGAKLAIGPRFFVELEGITVATFSECSGLGLTVATEKVEEGGVNYTTRKLPGRTDFTNLVLKHGVTSSTELFDWVKETINHRIKRKTLTLHVITPDPSGAEMTHWKFLRAFPVKWTGPTFQATSNAIAIETLELAHDGFEQT